MVVGDMTDIGKLGLSWPFSSKKFTTESWVSERYLGVVRTLKYLCGTTDIGIGVSEKQRWGMFKIRRVLDALLPMVARIMTKVITPKIPGAHTE
jgi:hypothetical protein